MTKQAGEAKRILQKTYGYNSFRGHQENVIDHVINGGNAFVLMPTGGGKSLCYQIPSLCRNGVGIIISPLIALMHDQVSALNQLGIRAAVLNSSMPFSAISQTKELLRTNNIDLVYIAPESLLKEDFLGLIESSQISLFAIDEAHCISGWGHDFRPHYKQLSILAQRFPSIPRIALTATADSPTRKDIIEGLQLEDGKTFISSFDRPNINYNIIEKNNPKQQLLSFINEHHKGDSGIIYCLSRKNVEELAQWLCAQGFDAIPYHAGMQDIERSQNQDKFLKDENIIMVATIAFGMGIDKPDVRFVVHMNIPKNIEAYYQETGRAGRDGLPANALMLYSMSDCATQRHFIDDAKTPDNQKRIEHQKLNALLGLCEASCCRRQILLEYFGDNCKTCGNCDTCITPQVTFDGTVAAQKAISCVYRTGQRFGVSYLIDVLLGALDERIRNFQHDKISTFSIGKEYDKAQWQSIFRQLVAQNLLMVDITRHGGIKITGAGIKFLKEKGSIRLRQYAATKKSTATPKIKTQAIIENPADQSLFDLLKAKRLELAKAQNIPPYIIFHDKTLREFAIAKPASNEDMSKIAGVGEAKLKRYGKEFLAVIANSIL